jgi:nucleoside phosphorylase
MCSLFYSPSQLNPKSGLAFLEWGRCFRRIASWGGRGRALARACVGVLLSFGCQSAQADTVAVLLALEADMKTLSAQATVLGEPSLVGTRKIQRLQLGPHRVHAAVMGSGCVETAVTAEALLARYRCDWVFSMGPAGGLTDEGAVGKWFAVSECVVAGKTGGSGSAGTPFKLALAPTQWKLPAVMQRLTPLRLVAGETFIQSNSAREGLAASSQAQLVDMNTHGLAVACLNHQVPLHVWRLVSDRADDQASAAFQEFTKSYQGEGGTALAEVIRQLPASPKAAGSYQGIRELIEPRTRGDGEGEVGR